MRMRTITSWGFPMRVKAEITPDTQLWTFMDEKGQRFYVACTKLGLTQFKASGYLPADGGMLQQLEWDLVRKNVSQDKILEIAQRTDWRRVRRVGREWNFV